MNVRLADQEPKHLARAAEIEDAIVPLGFTLDDGPAARGGQWETSWRGGRLRVSYVGYQQLRLHLPDQTFVGIRLAPRPRVEDGSTTWGHAEQIERLVAAIERARS